MTSSTRPSRMVNHSHGRYSDYEKCWVQLTEHLDHTETSYSRRAHIIPSFSLSVTLELDTPKPRLMEMVHLLSSNLVFLGSAAVLSWLEVHINQCRASIFHKEQSFLYLRRRAPYLHSQSKQNHRAAIRLRRQWKGCHSYDSFASVRCLPKARHSFKSWGAGFEPRAASAARAARSPRASPKPVAYPALARYRSASPPSQGRSERDWRF